MGRSEASQEKRKISKKRNRKKKSKTIKVLLESSRKENTLIKEEISLLKEQVRLSKQISKCTLSTVTKQFCGKKSYEHLRSVLPSTPVLSEKVISISDKIIGEGTFGKVVEGINIPLSLECAVKIGKTKYFDALFECRVFQKLQASEHFPRIFGTQENNLVTEIIRSEGVVKTLYSEIKKCSDKFDVNIQIKICYQVTDAVRFMHKNGLLHNDIKSNNILLKGNELVPILIDMGKVTSKLCPEVYKLTKQQQQKYNEKYLHLAFELRNIYGAKTSTFTDVYSLGYLFKMVGRENNYLKLLSKQMVTELPSKRKNIIRVLNSFKKTIV